MATGSICLPAWKPELSESSRGLAGSYVQLTKCTDEQEAACKVRLYMHLCIFLLCKYFN